MRVTIFFTTLSLVFLNSCQFDEGAILQQDKNYKKSISLYSSNINECERLSLQYFNEAFNSKNNIGVAKFAYLLGLVYSVKGKYAKSTEYLLMADYYYNLDGDKKNSAQCLATLGFVNNSLDKYRTAVNYLKKSLELENDDHDQVLNTYYHLAQSYIGLGRKDSAFKIIEDIILPDASDKFKEGLRYGWAGYLYIKAQNYERAKVVIEKSITLDNRKVNLASSFNNLAYIYMQKNELNKAMSLVQNSLTNNVNYYNSHALRTRAFIYIKEQKYASAIADFNASLKFKPNFGEVAKGYQLIAKAYEETGDITHSGKYWKLSTEALNEKSRLEEERAAEADRVQDAINDHNNKIMLAVIKSERKNKVLSWVIGIIVISFISYLFYNYRRKQLGIKSRLMNKVNRFNNL